MKRIAMMLVLIGMVAVSSATADDEKKKGWARYDDGFRFESADGENTLRISNRVQFRLTDEDPDDRGVDQ